MFPSPNPEAFLKGCPMNDAQSQHSLRGSIQVTLASVFVAVSLAATLHAWPMPLFLTCAHPVSQPIVLALGVFGVAQGGLVGMKILPRSAILTSGVAAALILLTLWLGSYPFSPLGFASGRIPVLRSFVVTTRTLRRDNVAPGATVTLASGAPAAIQPLLLPVEARCAWSSANEGSLDSLQTCETVYSPPRAAYDILKIRIQPGCGLPPTSAQIKISILP
jgi:hypothetical protein